MYAGIWREVVRKLFGRKIRKIGDVVADKEVLRVYVTKQHPGGHRSGLLTGLDTREYPENELYYSTLTRAAAGNGTFLLP